MQSKLKFRFLCCALLFDRHSVCLEAWCSSPFLIIERQGKKNSKVFVRHPVREILKGFSEVRLCSLRRISWLYCEMLPDAGNLQRHRYVCGWEFIKHRLLYRRFNENKKALRCWALHDIPYQVLAISSFVDAFNNLNASARYEARRKRIVM